MSQKIKTIKEYIALQKPSGLDWDKSGILEGLTTEDALILKEKLEEVARIILHGNLILKNKMTETVMFPIVRVTYTKHNYLIRDCLQTILYVDSRLESLKYEMDEAFKTAYYTIDVEAEYTSLLCDEIASLKL
jgi:hypothetical protein